MDATILQQFLDNFQDFVTLSSHSNWPNNETSEDELKNALNLASHIEKCLNKLHSRNVLDEFLNKVNKHGKYDSSIIKSCFIDPPKFILFKIMKSKSKTSTIDTSLTLFSKIFSEQKLEDCLTDIFVESASQETLIKHITILPKKELIHLKSILFLSQITSQENYKEILSDMLKDPKHETVEMIIVSLSSNDSKYDESIKKVTESLVTVMSSKLNVYQKFWKYLFNVDTTLLINVCIEHTHLFKLISTALIDCYKLIKEQISAELFYVNITYSELVIAAQRLCESPTLKMEFLDVIVENNSDFEFWNGILL